MSNAVEYSSAGDGELSIAAARPVVYLDGEVCDFLTVREINRGGWEKFGSARLAWRPVSVDYGELSEPEDIEENLCSGMAVSIRQVYSKGYGVVADASLFEGQVERVEKRGGGKGKEIEVIAKDFGATLSRVTVYGQHVADIDGQIKYLPGSETLFNPDGTGNRSEEKASLKGRETYTFARDRKSGRYWKCAEVIDYLLTVNVVRGQLVRPGLKALGGLTGGQVIRQLDVTGLNLSEALQLCCERVGLRFRFTEVYSAGVWRSGIEFYKPGQGRTIELNCQREGEVLKPGGTEVAEVYSRRHRSRTHRYIGLGDYKVYEATFDLKAGWDGALWDTDYDKFSPSTNPEFYKVRDVFRKWVLNEAGDYSGSPFDLGEAFDFSPIFGSDNWVKRNRRFVSCLSTDKQGESLGYYLEVSFDGGASWSEYFYAFNILRDECGIWLSSDQLDVDTWIAALKGALRFRITASVASDERLRRQAVDGPIYSTAPVVDHIVCANRRFKYRKVSPYSNFSGSSNESLGQPDEADDTEALNEYVRKIAETQVDGIEEVDVTTPYVISHCLVGDLVKSDSVSRKLPWSRRFRWERSRVERVRMDFENQHTELKLVRNRSIV